MPPHLLYDKVLAEFVDTQGMKLEDSFISLNIQDSRTHTSNKQCAWAEFQKKFVSLAKERAKIVMPESTREITSLEAKIDIISNDPLLTEEDRSIPTVVLKTKLSEMEQRRHKSTREMAKARNMIEGETISRYWSGINKMREPREHLLRLKKPNPPEVVAGPQILDPEQGYETHSQHMADMIKDYHAAVQSDEMPSSELARTEATRESLEIVSVKISAIHYTAMKNKLTDDNVQEALKLSANYTASGLNGISYEIWKILHARYKNAVAHEKRAFNIINTLRQVYNDVEENGMALNTSFSESWMCPLYKKMTKRT